MKLSEYFDRQFHFDRRDLREVEDAIQECAKLFSLADIKVGGSGLLDSKKGWRYQIAAEGEEGKSGGTTATQGKPRRMSISTTAMVTAAIQRLLGEAPRVRAAEGYDERPIFKGIELDDDKKLALERARSKSVESLARIVKEPESGKTKFQHLMECEVISGDAKECEFDDIDSIVVYSSTYGANDPASLGWCWDLLSGSGHEKSRIKISEAVTTVCTKMDSPSFLKSVINPKNGSPGGSAFLLLRLKRLTRALKAKDDSVAELPRLEGFLTEYFESQLHRQLSYGEIPDSRFDAAELAFCLEGLLLSESWRVDRRIMARAVELLRKSQEASSFWRSETPIVASDSGLVLLPVSLEAANSILASLSLFDGEKKLHEPVGADCIPLLSRFWRWLRSRRVDIDVKIERNRESKIEKLSGWHSEHVNDKKIIHLWETSQVLEFLLSFRHFLKLHIARTTLELSGVENDWPQKPFDPAKKVTLNEWKSKNWDGFEPWSFRTQGAQVGVYASIWETHVAPRFPIERGELTPWKGRSFSFLLYGPPGTGKSSVADNLAKVFDCRRISLSVSDFMAEGAAQMEARAKQIFEMLECQPFSVVLFDEFDPFMYDRDGEMFRKLSPEFQLMTNGMLPKLQGLRKKQSVVFIFATNYFDRIDSAIKRTGRFDNHYLLPLLDWRGRARAIAEFISKDVKKEAQKAEVPDFKDKDLGTKLTAKMFFSGLSNSKDRLSVACSKTRSGTALFGYTDLKACFDAAFSDQGVVGTAGIRSSALASISDEDIGKLAMGVLNEITPKIAEHSPAISVQQVHARLFRKVAGAEVQFISDVFDEYLGVVTIEAEGAAKGAGNISAKEKKDIELCFATALSGKHPKAKSQMLKVLSQFDDLGGKSSAKKAEHGRAAAKQFAEAFVARLKALGERRPDNKRQTSKRKKVSKKKKAVKKRKAGRKGNSRP
jgi:hypothetical protein